MPLFNIYGMSETTGAFSIMTHGKFNLKTAGYTMPG
jgi:long-subunit acyl-CoA synthetase (AMP-forming)